MNHHSPWSYMVTAVPVVACHGMVLSESQPAAWRRQRTATHTILSHDRDLTVGPLTSSWTPLEPFDPTGTGGSDLLLDSLRLSDIGENDPRRPLPKTWRNFLVNVHYTSTTQQDL